MKSDRRSSSKGGVGRKLLYILTSLVGVIVIIMSCVYGAFFHYYSKLNIVTDGEEDFEYVSDAQIRPGEDLDVDNLTDEEKQEMEENANAYKPGQIEYDFSDPDIINIMVVGTDARLRGRYRTNSDAMVLVSINKKTKKLFITSFMRDTLVDIPKGGNHREAGKGKLNAAFGYGGSKLLFKTYEKNFGIKMDKYVHMDFFSFVNIVNNIGGIDMYVTASEIKYMNSVYLYELNFLYNRPSGTDYLPEKTGMYHLNGKQALAYTRVRYVGGGDFGRTERQRKVIGEIIKKVKKLSVKKLSSFSERALHYVTTNLTQKDVMDLLVSAPDVLDYEQVACRIPIDKTYHSGKLNGTYVIYVDLQKNSDYWYSLVYLDKDISEDIYKRLEEEKAEEEAKKKADEEAKKAAEEEAENASESANDGETSSVGT